MPPPLPPRLAALAADASARWDARAPDDRAAAGAAAAVAAAGIAAALAIAARPRPGPHPPSSLTVDGSTFDVVVVGAGPAGAAAAWHAARGGVRSVALLDRCKFPRSVAGG